MAGFWALWSSFSQSFSSHAVLFSSNAWFGPQAAICDQAWNGPPQLPSSRRAGSTGKRRLLR